MKIRRLLRWLAVVVWFCLVVFLSQQAGPESADTSNWFAVQIVRILHLDSVDYLLFHAILRKVAHFFVHFILAWLTYRALSISYKLEANTIIGCLLICCTVAIFDESIQNIAPERAARVLDATLNLLGVLAGTFVGVAAKKLQAKCCPK